MKRWFARETESREPDDPASSLSGPQTSLALNVLYHQLRPDQKYHILDLGPASGTNVDFFAQFHSKVYIEDLYMTLSSLDLFPPEEGLAHEAVFEYLFPYWKNACFDVIMSWDLLNYLEPEEFRYLMKHLRRFCRRGTTLFSLISTLKHIPEKPTTFRILDPQHLFYESSSTVLRPCPRYEQTELNSLMPGFKVANSFLLRNGFKEYLFVCE